MTEKKCKNNANNDKLHLDVTTTTLFGRDVKFATLIQILLLLPSVALASAAVAW